MEKHVQSFDVCIVCALAEEARAFLEVAQQQCEGTIEGRMSPRYQYSYRFATLKNDKGELLNLHISWLPRYGLQEMTLHLSRVLEECQPRIAIMTGICAGDSQDVQLGDLVVAERTFTYDNGKFTRDEQGRSVHLHDTMTYQLDANILQFLGLFDDWKPLVAGLKRPLSAPEQREVACHLKPMASGSAVRSDQPFEDVQAPVRGTVAIDMEGAAFGLVMSRHPLIRWLVVKGVCDYADKTKNDDYHDYAARTSALYALSFIRAYVTNKLQRSISRRVVLAGLAITAAASATGGSIALLTRSQRIQASPTPITSGSTPVTSGTPGTTPVISGTPGAVLYQADLSRPDNIYKEWQGMIFSGDAGWKISNGALLSSGNNTDETIWAQFVPSTANYAIEAQIQVLTLPDGHSYSGPAVGLLLRGQQGWPGYLVEISGSFVLDTAELSTIGEQGPVNKLEAHYSVDLKPHIYRAEVKDTVIKLIIDTVIIFEDRDKENLFPSSGQVGLMTSLVPVKVTSFKVIAL